MINREKEIKSSNEVKDLKEEMIFASVTGIDRIENEFMVPLSTSSQDIVNKSLELVSSSLNTETEKSLVRHIETAKKIDYFGFSIGGGGIFIKLRK